MLTAIPMTLKTIASYILFRTIFAQSHDMTSLALLIQSKIEFTLKRWRNLVDEESFYKIIVLLSYNKIGFYDLIEEYNKVVPAHTKTLCWRTVLYYTSRSKNHRVISPMVKTNHFAFRNWYLEYRNIEICVLLYDT